MRQLFLYVHLKELKNNVVFITHFTMSTDKPVHLEYWNMIQFDPMICDFCTSFNNTFLSAVRYILMWCQNVTVTWNGWQILMRFIFSFDLSNYFRSNSNSYLRLPTLCGDFQLLKKKQIFFNRNLTWMHLASNLYVLDVKCQFMTSFTIVETIQ